MSRISHPNGLPVPTLGLRDVGRLTDLIVEAMGDAHDDLAAAQTISRQDGQGVYAQIWRSLCMTLSKKLSGRYDVQLIKPGRAAYRVPVIGDVLLFPWRPAAGQEPTDVPFGTSPTRERLWSQPLRQELLDFGDNPAVAEEPTEVADEAAVFEEATRRNLRVVIVAMTSDSQRLRCIEWGEAKLLPDGGLQWMSHQVLFDGENNSTPTSISTASFADGSPPASGIHLKPESKPEGEPG